MADPFFSSQFLPVARTRSTRITRRSQRTMVRVSYLVILSLLNAGCSHWPTAPWQHLPPVELTMQAHLADQPGTYTLSGTANLPDQSRILVQGIRDLQLPQQSSQDGDPNSYSILGRQIVEVKQGKWQAKLELWQVAPDGTYRESWQISPPRLVRPPRPSPSVMFLATFDPTTQSQLLQPQLRNIAKANIAKAKSVRFTPEGEWYLEAKQTMMAGLPSGQTTPPVTLPVGRRAATVDWESGQATGKTVPLPKQSQSTAPLSVAEQLY